MEKSGIRETSVQARHLLTHQLLLGKRRRLSRDRKIHFKNVVVTTVYQLYTEDKQVNELHIPLQSQERDSVSEEAGSVETQQQQSPKKVIILEREQQLQDDGTAPNESDGGQQQHQYSIEGDSLSGNGESDGVAIEGSDSGN